MSRPTFPKRAVVTGGMPYGNKQLHFGHIGGVFAQADIYARFLRNRIGHDNVVFVSGTDCYGALIELGRDKEGFAGTLAEYVQRNHEHQKATLAAYDISLNLYAASALGEAGEIHAQLSAEVFNRLHENGVLVREDTLQFYDEEKQCFLNGRQVTGRCPIQGCKSSIAYADECDLGHQYNPTELIAPVSVLSGKPPARRTVTNWFFDLPRYMNYMHELVAQWEQDPACRPGLVKVVQEFLRKPAVYVKTEPGGPSELVEYDDLAARERGVAELAAQGLRYRTGKTLVPFRLSGNVPWGIPVPEKDGLAELTFWVWPESLWAPVSFTKAVVGERWGEFWQSDDAKVYQFIGEDNIYFYAIAEMGLFAALNWNLTVPTIVPNKHLLFGKSKASSSSEIKPPMAHELLEHYTAEQLRLHFMNASLSERSVGFAPKAFMPGQAENAFDPVLNEGNLVTNVFNRLARSCFYTAQKHGYTTLPAGEVSPEIKQRGDDTILEYERMMAEIKLDGLFELLNVYLRDANKHWAAHSKSDDPAVIAQLLVDSFHALRVATALLQPMVPQGCDMLREYLNVDERLWDWQHIFELLNYFIEDGHAFKFLEPRVDFFKKHESQL
ncbi:MAG: class I tRNA ligase family protein [Oscillospiraceae bacterium]|nr:class I tRNA ligase family protein [Oscillospiraceae bacterium]